MGYFFICDYCNNEQTYYPYDPVDFEIECSECGEGLCTDCVRQFGEPSIPVCDSCYDDLDKPEKEA